MKAKKQRSRTVVTGSKTKCSEGCNRPEFIIANGDEIEYVCRPVLEDRLVDLVTNNDYVSFQTSDVDPKTKLQTIEVLG